MPKQPLHIHGMTDIGMSRVPGRPASHLIDCTVSSRFEIVDIGIARLSALPWVEYVARRGKSDMKLQLIVRVVDLPADLQVANPWPLIAERVLATILGRG